MYIFNYIGATKIEYIMFINVTNGKKNKLTKNNIVGSIFSLFPHNNIYTTYSENIIMIMNENDIKINKNFVIDLSSDNSYILSVNFFFDIIIYTINITIPKK